MIELQKTAARPNDALLDELVLANHILAAEGVVDGFGHVSVRSAHGDRFLLSRSLAPSMVTRADILEHGGDGAVLPPHVSKPYVERFIHSEIYRARSDVVAVVHSHAASVIPYAVTHTPLRPILHMTAFLGSGVPTFDIRDALGDSDMLIRSPQLGRALSDSLGNRCAVLQRGHGVTVVGRTLREAVFRAVYLIANARIQSEALRLGSVTFLSPGEAALAAEALGAQVDRAWSAWTAALTPRPDEAPATRLKTVASPTRRGNEASDEQCDSDVSRAD